MKHYFIFHLTSFWPVRIFYLCDSRPVGVKGIYENHVVAVPPTLRVPTPTHFPCLPSQKPLLFLTERLWVFVFFFFPPVGFYRMRIARWVALRRVSIDKGHAKPRLCLFCFSRKTPWPVVTACQVLPVGSETLLPLPGFSGFMCRL